MAIIDWASYETVWERASTTKNTIEHEDGRRLPFWLRVVQQGKLRDPDRTQSVINFGFDVPDRLARRFLGQTLPSTGGGKVHHLCPMYTTDYYV